MVGRARRATAKPVNYAKEQDFSDAEGIFSESEDEAPAPRARRSTGSTRPRKSMEAATEIEGEPQSMVPVYTEKGYDPMQLPLRERFPFMPELEADGSPRIELIVGRRPVDDKNAESSEHEDDEEDDSSDSDNGSPKKRRSKKKKSSPKKKKKDSASPQKNEHVEYEYLVKFKGRSYLHLEWKTGADLESMGKSAKTLYRRYLKKLAAGAGDDLESPDFDPSFAIPQKIVDAKEQEITLELTDNELVEWEKERQKAMAEDEAEREANEMTIEGADNVEGTETEKAARQGNGDPKEDEKKEDQDVIPGAYNLCFETHDTSQPYCTNFVLLSFICQILVVTAVKKLIMLRCLWNIFVRLPIRMVHIIL